MRVCRTPIVDVRNVHHLRVGELDRSSEETPGAAGRARAGRDSPIDFDHEGHLGRQQVDDVLPEPQPRSATTHGAEGMPGKARRTPCSDCRS
jgi:hypothetical protein